MSLSTRAIALEGIGFGARLVALCGFGAIDSVDAPAVLPTYGRPSQRLRRGVPRRWDWERDDEILLDPPPLQPAPMDAPAREPGERVRRSRQARDLELTLLGPP